MDALTIGQLAGRAGTTPEAIRYYERVGVLREPRRDSLGHRRYPLRVLDELRLLKASQAVGFSLAEIGRMLELTRQDPVRCGEMCAIVEERIRRIDDRLSVLAEARDRLAEALQACEPSDQCVVAERLVLRG